MKFKFFKGNLKDKEFQLSEKELAERFNGWIRLQTNNPNRGKEWMEEYYGEDAWFSFITDGEENGGLDSTFDVDQYESLLQVFEYTYSKFQFQTISL